MTRKLLLVLTYTSFVVSQAVEYWNYEKRQELIPFPRIGRALPRYPDLINPVILDDIDDNIIPRMKRSNEENAEQSRPWNENDFSRSTNIQTRQFPSTNLAPRLGRKRTDVEMPTNRRNTLHTCFAPRVGRSNFAPRLGKRIPH